MTRASIGSANTSAYDAFMGTRARICWKLIGRSARESARRLYGWRCRRWARTSSLSRTITSSCRSLISFTPTLKPSPRKSKGQSSTPPKATLNERSTTRHAATAMSRCGATDRQRRLSNTAGQTQQSTSSELSKRRSVGLRECWRNPKAMRMTRADWETHRTARRCHVCDDRLKGYSVRDHCHITGKYRGAAHSTCNLKLRLNPKTTTIPVVFHNLRGYDSHLLMQAISKVEGRMSCIPNSTKKYISFSLGQLRFIDSAQFLLASLDKLVSTNKPETFQITAHYEPDQHKCGLLLRKGVYPYEYVDSWERFEDTTLPPKNAFYSKLSDEHISDDDYEHAQRSGRPSGVKPWATTPTSTVGPTCCSLLMSFRPFGRPASASMASTRRTTTPAPAYLGMPSSRRLE
ncbi:hypothetical protein RRG08_048478 [Elysia crispata]|uniref:DNA-directed DNA polymerase n=1 Tax=Elysia crispata TaxID=231223 RepID=A0AAE1AAS7_9GAST|nr:hypothetical protein RRG08_048478 [Elysia crispata]